MNIKVIGCGNAFSNKNFNQSFLVEEDGRKMLIDCGMQTPQALAYAGLTAKDIDDIYISHAHADHCGGLEYFAFTRYDWAKRPRHFSEGNYAPALIANEQLMKDLWDKTLRGGLESMEGFVASIGTFFEPIAIAPNVPFTWQGWTVSLIQQVHIMSGSIIMPSFGIMFQKKGHKSVYFVTDSQHCSPRQMEEYYKQADIIFQDCECTGVNFRFEEGQQVYNAAHAKGVTTGWWFPWPEDTLEAMTFLAEGIQPRKWERFKFGSGVHANFAQLAGYESANSVRLSDEIKAKMYLSHYQDFVLDNKDMFGNTVDWDKEASKAGFKGFAHLNMELEV